MRPLFVLVNLSGGVTMRQHLLIMNFLCLACSCTAVQISSLTQNASAVGQYEKFEATFTLDTVYANPFDLEVIDVTAVVTRPDDSQVTVPAFYARQYEVVGASPERYRNPGPGQWKIRFAPSQPGVHSYDLVINEAGTVTRFEDQGSFTCLAGPGRGFIRRDEGDPLCLRYDDGSPRLNIGHNVCWESKELAGCQTYFNHMVAAGENWTRLWMCPWGNDGWIMLEYASDHWAGYFNGVGTYSLQTAQRLDAIVEMAEDLGIGIQLVLQYHGLFSTTTNSNWADNPYNAARPQDGGFLEEPEDFFSDAQAIRLTRNKVRYIIARWGYSPAILAWELWNEVQFTDGWANTPEAVVDWHREMADYIHAVDPHNHLITTSSHSGGFDAIWSLDSIDLVQVHHYGTPVISPFSTVPRELGAQFQKPVIIGEFGAGSVSGMNSETNVESLPEPYQTQMEEGLVLHNGVWSAFFSKSSSHLWWWDGYIEPYNQYPVFKPLAVYAAGEDLRGMQPAPRAVAGFPSWLATPQVYDFSHVHTQTHFYLDNSYFPGMGELSRYLQGAWHSAYRSDPTFHLTLPEAGQLKIHVSSVSSYGSNSLRVRVSGVQVFASSYAAGASNFTISVPLPAGEIAVQIENTGQDWFEIAGYEFAPGAVYLLNSTGLQSEDRALLWIYDINSQYGSAPNGLFTGEQMTLRGLADGTYDVDFYATRGPGGIIHSTRVDSQSGRLSCTIPDFTGDIAVKVRKTCMIGLDDLAVLAAAWLSSGPNLPGDFDGNSQVNLTDLEALSRHWFKACPADWLMP